MTSLFGAPYFSMIPVYARDVFHMDESGNALLMGFSGAGAFVGALVLAYLGDFRHKGWSVLCGSFAFAACVVAFAYSTRLTVSLVFLFLMGFAIVSCVAFINTLLQKLVTDEMRGRVMSMFIFSFIGTNAIATSPRARPPSASGPRTRSPPAASSSPPSYHLVAVRYKRLRELIRVTCGRGGCVSPYIS